MKPPRKPAAPAPQEAAARTGTQSIERAAQLLRVIAGGEAAGGMRLVDIVAQVGMETPTVHRMMKGLVSTGLVARDEQTRRYRLGALVYELGIAAMPRSNFQALCEASVTRLAEASGDVAMMAIRSGVDSVCMDRREGSFPVKTLTVLVGTRRPLGVGSGGLAMLGSLPPERVAHIIDLNARRLAQFNGLTRETLHSLAEQTRQNGFALSRGEVFPEVGGVGVTIWHPDGEPVAAFSISTTVTRLPPERVQWLVKLMRSEASAVEAMLREG